MTTTFRALLTATRHSHGASLPRDRRTLLLHAFYVPCPQVCSIQMQQWCLIVGRGGDRAASSVLFTQLTRGKRLTSNVCAISSLPFPAHRSSQVSLHSVTWQPKPPFHRNFLLKWTVRISVVLHRFCPRSACSCSLLQHSTGRDS